MTYKHVYILQEMKSEVQETVEDLPEDADLLHDPEHVEETISASSRTPSVGEISTLSPTDTERSLGGFIHTAIQRKLSLVIIT